MHGDVPVPSMAEFYPYKVGLGNAGIGEYAGDCGLCPQRGPGASRDPCQGVWRRRAPEAESFLLHKYIILYFLRCIVEAQHLDFTCNNQLAFTKYHVVKKTLHAGGHRYILDHAAYKYQCSLHISDDISLQSNLLVFCTKQLLNSSQESKGLLKLGEGFLKFGGNFSKRCLPGSIVGDAS